MLTDEDIAHIRARAVRWLRVESLIVLDLLDEIARLRAELDRRPEITPEDAALHTGAVTFRESVDASQRIHAALRAHAQKARPVCTCSRRLGDYCPTPDPDCKAHTQKAGKP